MKKIISFDITYRGKNSSVRRINDSVTIKNAYSRLLGFSLEEAKELYDLLGALVADTYKETK